ncbi:ATP-binding cassette domain-containing protein [Desulfovibrio sp.]|uniref:ATP-binding cassette domain-containing protein n=1 Tax=Desulfovibrio sp. TaxID=885 RepID=UPI0023BBC074|nr:ATP-binding cassette domain-containing protein [Desulfovibrio sp.]MDE7240463.1 ATP-binding cassette domain-containing protein [Desulfovibrio sp.]
MTTGPAGAAPAPESAPAIVLEGLRMDFGEGARRKEALKGVSASIPAGRITGLVGPDASGKTTLMRLLAGLLAPTAGSLRIYGLPVDELLRREPNSIAYMPQRFGLYEDLTVMANLRLYASLRGVEGEAREALFRRLLAFTALAPFTERLAGRLSGGMKQKLGIACALLGAPRLLLLDEPGVGVDPQSRRELWSMVQELSRGGMTVLWSTSYLDEAARCPGVVMLDGGATLFAGPPEELTRRARGRVFLIRDKASAEDGGNAHREALAYWTMKPGVIDVLIQGSSLRVVLAADATPEVREEVLAMGGAPVAPRLEDAYMGAVGGIDKRPSPYGKLPGAAGGVAGGPAASPDSGPRILANHLTRKFGDFVAARDICFKVRAGEIFGLLGPNGAGKSTTFRMLCGLLRPTSGDCAVDGVDLLRSGSAARERLGYMAQNFSLYPDITVRENISIFADLYGLSPRRREALLPALASALDLAAWLKARTGSLPLGLKKRLALLCATLHEPPVLFLDEPTSGVDVRTRRDFWKHISALTAAGAAVLVTTHFMEEAEYCDRIALIYCGSIISVGTPDELKAQVTGMKDPTLEDAFIAFIERYDKEHPL